MLLCWSYGSTIGSILASTPVPVMGALVPLLSPLLAPMTSTIVHTRLALLTHAKCVHPRVLRDSDCSLPLRQRARFLLTSSWLPRQSSHSRPVFRWYTVNVSFDRHPQGVCSQSKQNMPKGPALTTAERDEIRTLHAKNVSAREIAKKIERSKTVVLNYLRNPTQYGQTKRSGRKRALTPEQEEQIYTALRQQSDKMCVDPTSKMSAERIRREFNLPLSTRRIQQLLSDWRRQARKATDQQHAVDEVVDENTIEDAPPAATETDSAAQDTDDLLPSSIIV